ncbi:hypothetical protein HDR59_04660 [bacterium]|nr:hypothetical protein [bacterium]
MLNKKLLYITTAGLVASVFPVNTDAQTFYQCMPCPIGTYSKNGKCEACPLGTYSTSTGAGSCLSCDSTEFSNADRTRCFKINDKENWNTSPVASPSAGKCVNYTIPKSGLYAVYLRGGNGSSGRGCCNCSIGNGQNGGYVAYRFVANAGTSIELCAGGNATSGINGGTAGGGGAGSWIKIGGSYIVAGGGGGGGYVGGVVGGATNDRKGQAGGGGAIGAGGSGDDYSCSGTSSGSGGSVGPYSGGAGQSHEHDGVAGTGINADNTGKGGRSGGGYGRGGSATGVTLYTGSVRVNVGGAGNTAGSATHNSNISLTLGCSSNATGCAALYSWRLN